MARGISSPVNLVNRVSIIDTRAGRRVRREWATPEIAASLGIDPQVEVTAQQLAAQEGFAPEIEEFDPVSRMMIMEFVEGMPLERDWMTIPARRAAMREMIDRLRSLSSPPLPSIDLGERLRALHQRLARRAPPLAESRRVELEAVLQRMPADVEADTVLVHGDLTPENVIVRPDGALCLLDWEYAHRGHGDEDLAGLALVEARLADWSVAPVHFGHRVRVRGLLDALWLDLATTLA